MLLTLAPPALAGGIALSTPSVLDTLLLFVGMAVFVVMIWDIVVEFKAVARRRDI